MRSNKKNYHTAGRQCQCLSGTSGTTTTKNILLFLRSNADLKNQCSSSDPLEAVAI